MLIPIVVVLSLLVLVILSPVSTRSGVGNFLSRAKWVLLVWVAAMALLFLLGMLGAIK